MRHIRSILELLLCFFYALYGSKNLTEEPQEVSLGLRFVPSEEYWIKLDQSTRQHLLQICIKRRLFFRPADNPTLLLPVNRNLKS